MKNKYTKKEIHDNISKLKKEENKLKIERAEISKEINELGKRIKEWECLDESQLKII